MEPDESFWSQADFIRKLARKRVGDPTIADDIVQETWLRAQRAPWPGAATSRPWLTQVAKNLIAKWRRGETRRSRRERLGARGECVPSSELIVAERAAARRVAHEVDRLAPRYRTPVQLRYFDGLTVAQIARHLDVPHETVRTRLRRAQASLRVRLGESFDARTVDPSVE